MWIRQPKGRLYLIKFVTSLLNVVAKVETMVQGILEKRVNNFSTVIFKVSYIFSVKHITR